MRTAAAVPQRVDATAAGPRFADLRRRFTWYLLWPTLAVLIVVTLLPTLYLIVTSFTPLNLTQPDTAWNFSQPLVNYEALRTLFLIPMVLPPIVVAIIWKVLYTPDISPFYYLFAQLGWDVPSLITSADWALSAIIVADTWEWFPFTMLMILAALQMMPEEYVDAAKIDGANVVQMTLYVTLPYLRGVLLVAGLFRLIDSIKAFPLIFILTDGGPGTVTEVTNFYSYIQAFNFSYLGYSSAITVLLVAITVLLSWLVIRMVGWGQHAE